MSKHYEVLHKAGKDRDLFSTSVPALPAGSSGAIMLNGNKRVHEETMKLIQRTFLSGTPGAPRILVFTAVDRGSGCSWVCAHTAKALAELVDGMVCVVEANPQAKSLQSQLNMSADCGHKDAASQ